jgi:drug/metabolite transporter, DME family
LPDNSAVKFHPIRGYFYIAAAGLCWAISAALGKIVFTGRALPGGHPLAPLDPVILSQTRTTIALLLLAPILLLARGRAALQISARDLLRCMWLGILGLAGSNFFYYYAIEKTAVSIAIIVQYTAPVWVLLYMVARRHERATLLRTAAVLAAVAGSALAIGIIGQQGVKLVWIGVLASLLAAFSFSFYNVYGRSLLLQHDRWKVITYALLGAAVFWLVVHSPAKVWAAHYSAGQWLFMLIFALLSMLIPFSFYFAGLRYLDPTRAIVTSCLEPVFTILVAALFLEERMKPLQIFGMLLVLLATVVVQLPEKSRRGPHAPAAI